MIRALAALVLALLACGAQAAACRELSHEGNRYTVCEVDPKTEDLRLFLRDGSGAPYGDFAAVDAALGARGQRLGFAMNAGMYHDDRRPVGLYVEDGAQEMRLVTNPGPGNFGLLPNGVFCIGKGWARVIETLAFAREKPACRYATQSGPMLVIAGKLHPRFLANSTSRHVRNGVGTTGAGDKAVFVISDNAVTFHEFGRLFRDVLHLPQALYFDGNVSRLFAPEAGRSDLGRAMGPIVGTVTRR